MSGSAVVRDLITRAVIAAAVASGGVALGPGSAGAQHPDDTCRRHLVQCNWARYYSGTITWEGVVRVDQDPGGNGAIVSVDRDVLTLRVTDGEATCTGSTRKGQGATYDAGKAVGETTDSLLYSGPGLVTVEFGTGLEGDE